MATDVLPLRIAERTQPLSAVSVPDLAVTTLPVLTQLRDCLRDAVRFRDRCRLAERRSGHGTEAPLFFFSAGSQAEWNSNRQSSARFPSSHAASVASHDPSGAAAWNLLPKFFDVLESRLLESVEVRRAARAVPNLVAVATALAADHPRTAWLAELLAVPDDEVLLVIHPESRSGWRLHVRGIADVAQFHVLFADTIGEYVNGAVEVYRGGFQVPPDDVPEVAARFQFFGPRALRPDGTLPLGLSGNRHWIWGKRPLAGIPRIDGERVVLIAEPSVPVAWDAIPRFPQMPASVRVIERLASAAVDAWIGDWTGSPTTHEDRNTLSGTKPAPSTVFGSTPSQSRSTAA